MLSCLRPRALGPLLIMCFVALGTVAHGQSDAQLKSERDAALARILADPTDREAMQAFSRASIRLREFEPAISTLERYLDVAPNDMTALYELAVSYFALGAYGVADVHFERLEAANIDDTTLRLVAQYRAAIAERTAPSGFKGRVAAGLAYSTNANLASDLNTVFLLGTPLTRVPGTGPEGDAAGTFSARVEHRHDLGLASGDMWFTEAGVEAMHFFDQRDGDFDGLYLRSGPWLSLNEFAFGPKLRPYAEYL